MHGFSVGDAVILPTQGVAEVVDITPLQRPRGGLSYHLRCPGGRQLQLPVAHAEILGVRWPVTAAVAHSLLAQLSQPLQPVEPAGLVRHRHHLRLIEGGTLEGLATVLRALHARVPGHTRSQGDQRLYERALALVADEVGCVLGLDPDSATAMVEQHLG